MQMSFNSLQTGRSFRTKYRFSQPVRKIVSIPFKREGLSEQNLPDEFKGIRNVGFNSLQTGRSFRTEVPAVLRLP